MGSVIDYSVQKMLHNKVINEEQKTIIAYGLDLLLFSTFLLVSFVLFGVFLGRIWETICFFSCLIPLQSFGGGYHCMTHLRCTLVMVISYLLAIYLLVEIPGMILLGVTVAIGVIFFTITPIENVNAPFSELFKIKMHRVVTGIYLIDLVIAIVLMLQNNTLSKVICTSIIISGFSIVAAKTKQICVKTK